MITEEERKRMMADLKNTSNSTVDSGMFSNIFRKDKTFKQWEPTAKKHEFDIIPYKISANHPLARNKKEGVVVGTTWWYMVQVYVHGNVGINKERVVCNLKTFRGIRCPICEEGDRQRIHYDMKDEVQKKAWRDKYGVSLRVFYNVVVANDDAEFDKGVQILEASNFYMEEPLSKLIDDPREGQRYYSDPSTAGYSIYVNRNNDQMKSYDGHALIKRVIQGKPYDVMEFLPEAYCIEDLIYWPTPEEVYDLFWAGESGPGIDAHKDTSEYDRGSSSSQDAMERAGRLRGRSDQPADTGRQPADTGRQPADTGRAQSTGAFTCPGGGAFGIDLGKLDCQNCSIYLDCTKEFETRKDAASAQSVGAGGPVSRRGTTDSAPPDTESSPVGSRRRRVV